MLHCLVDCLAGPEGPSLIQTLAFVLPPHSPPPLSLSLSLSPSSFLFSEDLTLLWLGVKSFLCCCHLLSLVW